MYCDSWASCLCSLPCSLQVVVSALLMLLHHLTTSTQPTSNTLALITNSSYHLALLLHVAIPFSHQTHFHSPLFLHDAHLSQLVQVANSSNFFCALQVPFNIFPPDGSAFKKIRAKSVDGMRVALAHLFASLVQMPELGIRNTLDRASTRILPTAARK